MDLRAVRASQLGLPKRRKRGDALHHLESLRVVSVPLCPVDEVGAQALSALVLLLLLATLGAPLVLCADEGAFALLGVRELSGWGGGRSELEEARVVKVEVLVVFERHVARRRA